MTDNRLPIVFLGSSTGMHNQINICHALGRPIVGIYDTDYSGQEQLHGLTILKELPTLECEYFVATTWTPFEGRIFERNRQKRLHLLDFMQTNQLPGATLIHPTTVVIPGALIGRNVSIGAQSYISHGVRIESNVLIREQVFIGHDVTVGENAVIQIKSTITGNTDVESGAYVGVGSTVVNRMPLNRITIGENSLIYPNEVVLTSVPKNNTVRSRRLRG